MGKQQAFASLASLSQQRPFESPSEALCLWSITGICSGIREHDGLFQTAQSTRMVQGRWGAVPVCAV